MLEERRQHESKDTSLDTSAEERNTDALQKRENDAAMPLSPHRYNLFSVTVALSICMMAHSYLLISVFPYSGFMAAELVPGVDEDNAGSYAGILASALMIGRAATSFGWGKVSDWYGRTTVLVLSLTLAMILSVLFGLSPSFGWALFLRFCLGASNGILGTLRTTVSEISQGDEKVELRTMTIIMGMWSWAFLVSPAISGSLAEPAKQYPGAQFVERQGTLYNLLTRFPFLLPNVVGALLCFIAVCFVVAFVKETLPPYQQRDPRRIPHDILSSFKACGSRTVAALCCRQRQKAYKRVDGLHSVDVTSANCIEKNGDGTESSEDSENSLKDDDNDDETPAATVASILSRPETRTLLLVYWAAAFVSVAFNEIFPLFCMSRVAGLGLDERHIGQIMSLCGLIFAVSQYGAQSLCYTKFGLIGTVRASAIAGTPMIFLVPLSLLFNEGAEEEGELNIGTLIFLAMVLALNRVCVMVFYSNVSVAMNRSVPPSHRGAAQGVCGMGENIAKGLGPFFAGILTSFSASYLGEYGSILMFATVGLVGTLFAATTVFALRADPAATPEQQDALADNDDEVELVG